MRYGWRMGVMVLAGLAMAQAASAQSAYVADTGLDTAAGTINAPFKTIQRAIQAQARDIYIKSGQYILESPLSVPPQTTIRGSYAIGKDLNENTVWLKDTHPTILLLVGQVGQASIVLTPSSAPQIPGGALENVTLKGGYVGVSMSEGTRLYEVRIDGATATGSGAQLAAISVSHGANETSPRPALIDRCWIYGGNTGIRVDNTGDALIRKSLLRDATGRGITIAGTGDSIIEETIIEGADSDAISISGAVDVTVSNCAILKNAGDGLRAVGGSVTVQNCLLQANARGLSFTDSTTPLVLSNTIVKNRKSGVYMLASNITAQRNLITSNALYGVEEDLGVPEYHGTTPVRILDDNLFFQNTLGNYLKANDSLKPVRNTAPEINELNGNEIAAQRNLVLDPLYTDAVKGNFRPSATSPALDRVAADPNSTRDVDGNPRTVDIPGQGNEDGTKLQDLGAFERNTSVLTHFGAFGYDSSQVADIFNPGGPSVELKTAPEWSFTSLTPNVFQRVVAEFLPGRLRLYSSGYYTFGAAERPTPDVLQPQDKVAVMRSTLEALDSVGIRNPRFRTSGHGTGEIAQGFVIEGSKQLFPTNQGREYEFIYDNRQGGYRSTPPIASATYGNVFNIDFLDFSNLPYQSKVDLTRFEIQYIDRTLFDAQFSQLGGHWTFDDGAQEWNSAGIPEFFNLPVMVWDGGRKALRLAQVNDNAYGSWYSPHLTLPPGTLYRIELKISASSDDVANIPSPQVRLSPDDFSFTQSMRMISATNGASIPRTTAKTYVMYGRIPASLTADVTSTIFFDLWGVAENRVGSLYLEEATVTLKP